MKPELLENTGLSKNESKTYLALIRLGSASVSDIAKKTNVHRVNIYDVLESLQKKGLVASVIKANKKIFTPSNPEELKKIIKEKERELKETEKGLSELSNIYKEGTIKKNVQVFKGKLGIKTVLKEILDSKTEIINFGSSMKFPNFYPEYFDVWESKRIKKGIKMRIVTSKSIKGKVPAKRLQKIKFLKMEFENKTSTFVYDEKVASFIWVEEPIAILIQNTELAESHRNYFNFLWREGII